MVLNIRSHNETNDFHATDHLRTSGELVLSYSQIATWMTCRHSWRLSYLHRIRTIQPKAAVALGDAIHRYVAAYLLGQDPAPAMHAWLHEIINKKGSNYSIDEQLGYEDMGEKAERIGKRTIEYLRTLGWQTLVVGGVPLVEAELATTIPGWDRYVMHVDWVAIDPRTQQIWLADFKTRKSFLPDFSEETNLQHVSYLKVLRDNGIPAGGTATIQIASEVPNIPKINRDGVSVSRSAIKTDWETYKAVVESVGGDPADYFDMEQKLRGTTFHNVLLGHHSDTEITNVWDRIIVPAANDILQARQGTVPTYRVLNHRVCNGCFVRNQCVGALRGYDHEGLLLGTSFHEEDRAEIVAGMY